MLPKDITVLIYEIALFFKCGYLGFFINGTLMPSDISGIIIIGYKAYFLGILFVGYRDTGFFGSGVFSQSRA